MRVRRRRHGWMASLAAAALIVGSCGGDDAAVPVVDRSPGDGSAPSVLDPIIFDPPPDGLVLEFGARLDRAEHEDAVEVYGRDDLGRPFDGPLAIYSWMPGEVVAEPPHEPVDLGGIDAYYSDLSEEIGPTLAKAVTWGVDGVRHEVVGLDTERDHLLAIAAAAAAGSGAPEGWTVILRAAQPDGIMLSYANRDSGNAAWLTLNALAGDEGVYELLRALESRGACRTVDQAVCGEPIEVREQDGFLVHYVEESVDPSLSGEVTVIGWIDRSGWVVTIRAAGMSLEEVLAATERLVTVSWAEFDERVDPAGGSPLID